MEQTVKTLTGQTFYDCRYADFFTISKPIAPINNDIELSDADFKEYVLSEWLAMNKDRYILTYQKGKIETCQINWLLHHIEAKQYLPKI